MGFLRENPDISVSEMSLDRAAGWRVKHSDTIVCWLERRVDMIGADDLVPLMVFTEALISWGGVIDDAVFLSWFAVFQYLLAQRVAGNTEVAHVGLFDFDNYEQRFQHLSKGGVGP